MNKSQLVEPGLLDDTPSREGRRNPHELLMARDPLAKVHAEAVRTRLARDAGAQPSRGETPPTD